MRWSALVDTHVAIVGAGPYGLAVAAQLRRSRIDFRVFGDPMSFWRGMPHGMLLRSNWSATCIADDGGPLSLDAYQAATGVRFRAPVPLERFVEYGEWVQQRVAPDVDRRTVTRIEADRAGFRLTLDNDESVHARRVVVACGIGDFAARPPEFAHLPPELASHTGQHADLSAFAGERVLIVGGGQSALESAALIHEAGGAPEVVARAEQVRWLHGGTYQRALGRAAPLFYAHTDVGPLGLSRLVAVPDLFRRLPRALQSVIARRAIRPAGAAWLRPRLERVPLHVGERVVRAEPANGSLRVTLLRGGTRDVDHLLLGTGYRVDVARYPFLDPQLVHSIRQVGGYPALGPGLESSVPGLHFVGAPAAWSFGPVMRFVSGSWYASRAVARRAQSADAAAAPAPVHTARRA